MTARTLRPRPPREARVLILAGDDTANELIVAVRAALDATSTVAFPSEWGQWSRAELRAACAAAAGVLVHGDRHDGDVTLPPLRVIGAWLDDVYGSARATWPPRATVEWLDGKAYVEALLHVMLPHTAVLRDAAALRSRLAVGPFPMRLKPTWQSSGRDHWIVPTADGSRDALAYAARIFRSGRALISQPNLPRFVETKKACAPLTAADSPVAAAVLAAAAAAGVPLPWVRIDTVEHEGVVYLNEIEAIDACLRRDEYGLVAGVMAGCMQAQIVPKLTG
jgi:hypothetical protein